MNRSEAGKLGGIATTIITQERKLKRIVEYNVSPKQCKYCEKAFSYAKRHNTFCDHSCSASFNNGGRKIKSERVVIATNCLICDTRTTNEKYCSNKCNGIGTKNKHVLLFLTKGKEWKGLKGYLVSLYGHKCVMCEYDTWNDKPIPLELDHIDGNSGNTELGNYRLLCPNCHAQTDTYKGKNKGKGRFKRKQRYKNGKSY